MQNVYTFQSENFYFLSGEKKGTKNKFLYYMAALGDVRSSSNYYKKLLIKII